jgi:hypothetical protein
VLGEARIGDRLELWLQGRGPRTLGTLIEVFGPKSFALCFVVLMAVPALPIPTGGVTNVAEAITMLLALELVAGRQEIWLPKRLRAIDLSGLAKREFAASALARIRWVERLSRPRLARLLGHRASGVLFGLAVFVLSLFSFVAPPFSGLDTLPALGVVLLSLGVLFEDLLLALVGLVVGALGAVLVLGLARLTVELFERL